MFSEEITKLIFGNLHLIGISCFGGLVLFGLKLTEYINRVPEDKMSTIRACVIYFLLFIILPVLGGAVLVIYLINGDRMSAVLAFQVGLTSPAIVQSMIIAAANNAAKVPVSIDPQA